MDITDIKIFKVKGKGKIIGVANVVISNKIVLRGIKIIDGVRGRFIAMPSRIDKKFKEPKFRDHFHPINQEARDELTEAILNEFNRLEE